MKTNHSRGFVGRSEDGNNRRVSSSFKRIASKAFRSKARRVMNNRRDDDNAVFPTHPRHGEDVWNYD